MTPLNRCRLEHAAQLIDEVRDVCESLDLQKSTAKLTLAAEKIRETLAPEIGDEPDAQIAGPIAIANNLKAVLAAFDHFRVLGSCPAPGPQVDVIDGETA